MKILIFLIIEIIKYISLVIPLFIAIAYLTLVERKVIGSMQKRLGPNVVGFFGLLQPIVDGVKLLLKETVIPSHANKIIFIMAPMITFILSLLGWVVIPFDFGMVLSDINIGILYLFGISSLGVYGIITAGWSSNSKYAFLGDLRSASQMISYEVSIGLILISVIICVGSLNLSEIVLSQRDIFFIIPHFPAFLMFFISALAETNRAPFDLPEAEAELVSGYNVEYSSMSFALFFLGEYSNIILMSSLTVIFFLGGWLPLLDIFFFNILPGYIWFGLKTVFIMFLFIWVRSTFPRYRYDQLMRLGWKVFLPLSIGWVIFVSGFLISLDMLPYSY